MKSQLDVRNVSHHFGGIKAVNSVSFSIGAGHITGLVGPNGAGKTTLFNLITGTIKPASGEIYFEDRLISGCSPGLVANAGLIRSFQSAMVLPSITVREHLQRATLFKSIGRPLKLFSALAIREASMKSRDIAEDILDFTGLRGHADDPGDALPYGLQKILGVGMAIAAEPKMLLADEPAAGLNGAETARMEALLRAIHAERNIAVVVIEHDLPMVMRLCSRIIALGQGSLIADGTPGEVRRSPRFIEAYLGSESDAA